MTNTAAIKEPTRIVPVNRPVREKIEKINYAEIIEDWEVKTNIIDLIKRNDPNKWIKIKITPDMALDILTLNDMEHNRHLKEKKIREYTKSMKDRTWKEGNGDTIRISKDMKLLDGQHRLWSIWLSKRSIEYIIVTGLPPDAFAYIDIGANRTAADITSINGYQVYDNQLAYAIKQIILFEKRGIVKSAISSNDIPNSEVNDWQQDNARMEWMLTALNMIKATWMEHNKKFFTVPQYLAIFFVLSNLPNRKRDAKDFMDKFAEGVDLARTSPIKVARGYFENDMAQFVKNKKRNRVTRNILAIKWKVLFKAWDLWLDGATCSQIDIDLVNEVVKRPNWKRSV